MIREPVYEFLRHSGHGDKVDALEARSRRRLTEHGDYPRWQRALHNLPAIENPVPRFDQAAVAVGGHCDDPDALRQGLLGLMPWRKGPFEIAGVAIDSEWRSDLKWARVLPSLAPLRGRRVLDVGCGNGYYAWRMLAESPRIVVGIEPSVLFNLQFAVLQKYLGRTEIGLLPVGIEDLPTDLGCFDSVFSMGVLYHRRSPIDHLYQLRAALVGGGELCLETLVIEGGAGRVLVPANRYARMRNVWFIPSVDEMLAWLLRCGFVDARVVDVSTTTVDEQRSTEWMRFESLAESLDPANPELTVEGYPAPRRAVFLARRGG